MIPLRGAALLLAASVCQAQPRPSFEVVSIHPAPPITVDAMRAGSLRVRIDGARAELGGRSLTDLITRAYGLRSFQIAGPDWMTSARFDIVAKLPDGAPADQIPDMLQSMLADRFKLALHRENREYSVYVLGVAKDGPKLTPRPPDFDPASRTIIRPHTMANLTDYLNTGLERPVVNQTGLPGEYMLSLEDLAGDFLRRMVTDRPDSITNERIARDAANYSGPDVFGVLKSWGLTLESRKAPLPTLVIDHIEKSPTQN